MDELLEIIRQLDEDETIFALYHDRGRRVNVKYVETKVLGDYLSKKVGRLMELIDEQLVHSGRPNTHNWLQIKKAGYNVHMVHDEYAAILDTNRITILFECD